MFPSSFRWLLAIAAAVCAGCSGSCGNAAPANGPAVVTIPAFEQWPALRLLLEVEPKPVAKWDVTPLANAVYLAARACPDELKKGALTARFSLAEGKTAAAAPHPGGNACLESAVVGRDVSSLSHGSFHVVANLVPVAGDAGR